MELLRMLKCLKGSFIANTVKKALELGLRAMILKEGNEREVCMIGMKICQMNYGADRKVGSVKTWSLSHVLRQYYLQYRCCNRYLSLQQYRRYAVRTSAGHLDGFKWGVTVTSSQHRSISLSRYYISIQIAKWECPLSLLHPQQRLPHHWKHETSRGQSRGAAWLRIFWDEIGAGYVEDFENSRKALGERSSVGELLDETHDEPPSYVLRWSC